ncbi:MAG: hypothetical protein NTZ39_10260 [Methanoregula sp.]|nr:hypothetical protein [Methanoregula sp.]
MGDITEYGYSVNDVINKLRADVSSAEQMKAQFNLNPISIIVVTAGRYRTGYAAVMTGPVKPTMQQRIGTG